MHETLHSPKSFRAILPIAIAVEETDEDVSESELFIEEKSQVIDAVRSRRREFATVRACARQSLGHLGYPPVPILSGRRHEPIWPDGIVRSMTHCDGYRAAAVASKSDMTAIGIDAEINEPLPVEVADLIISENEAQALRYLASSEPYVAWDRLLFSIKESIFKTWRVIQESLPP
ncbi:MAG: 4'-phosphopantetheinyl transferase superfamily protein [Propionibacterium sp.]|jgi:phosphopantetheinyl transferase|nr:4'-phosphopantetheinyl transferase superfamily protein [Propionibacterium sp.]MBB1577366.1 4'-phosphopantetheinyl transferase superfamily protein [Propionibacterium sp.]